jgi:DNA-binding winged helix-turn-helix (wHTH) protein/tetratricopeptide (TPR) repeat protein
MSFTPEQLQAGFLIGACRIEPRENRIMRGEAEFHVEPRVMDVLVCLAAHAGEVVSRDTLNQQVWTQIVVTDQAVTNCISELRHCLGDDRSAHRVIETIPKRGYRLVEPVRVETHQALPRVTRRSRALLAVGLLLLGALSGFAWWWSRPTAPAVSSVAVLRFENAAGDASLDYLTLALPDEVATLLTKSRDVAVRPFEYVDSDDPLAVARARHIDHLVSGRYYLEDNAQLSLAIEAQHVGQERVIWRTRVSAPAGDLLAMRGRIAESVRQGLLPALGASAGPAGAMPVNDEAYQLYLRSLALPQRPKPGERAIEMLERAVTLEPTFALAWQALGGRYYALGTWWGGGEPARQKALAAHRKAWELDPDLIMAARDVVTRRAEAGDLEGAYHDAQELLERFGPGAETHFTLSYVYRYGGLMDQAQRHCELALERDPQNPRLRSCGYAYLYAGKKSRVMDFFLLDEGSYFVNWATALYEMRFDGRDAALHAVRQAPDDETRRLMQPCLEGVQGAALDNAVAEFVALWMQSSDPETAYAIAPMLVYCGRPREAVPFLERGVDGRYCSYPSVDLDPIWAGLRGDPEFQRIRTKAKACHDEFRRMVAAFDAASNH